LLEHSGRDPKQAVVDAQYKLLREKVLPLTQGEVRSALALTGSAVWIDSA